MNITFDKADLKKSLQESMLPFQYQFKLRENEHNLLQLLLIYSDGE